MPAIHTDRRSRIYASVGPATQANADVPRNARRATVDVSQSGTLQVALLASPSGLRNATNEADEIEVLVDDAHDVDIEALALEFHRILLDNDVGAPPSSDERDLGGATSISVSPTVVKIGDIVRFDVRCQDWTATDFGGRVVGIWYQNGASRVRSRRRPDSS